jgi:hypothetical protein
MKALNETLATLVKIHAQGQENISLFRNGEIGIPEMRKRNAELMAKLKAVESEMKKARN